MGLALPSFWDNRSNGRPPFRRKVVSKCLKAFVDIGIKCLAERSVERPTIGDAHSNLELVLSLQHSLDKPEKNVCFRTLNMSK